jgi:hypothetical protein
MRLPVIDGKPQQIDEEKAVAMIEYALAHGVTYFDTAFVYHSEIPFQAGMSELFLGRALGGRRSQVKLATKLPCWLVKSRSDMDYYLNLQLERLQTDYLDFYLLHSLTHENWAKLKALGVTEFLDSAIADGRIKYAGFSFHDDLPLFKEIVDSYNWSFCQIQYNFMDEEYQAGREGMNYAAAKGLGVIVMEPLRGGGLTDRLPREVEQLWSQAEVKRSPAEWALRFIWDKPQVSVVLSGMSQMAQVEENCAIAATAQPDSLTAAELALIQQAKLEFLARIKVHCTGCGYCMPCPAGVNIPGCFLHYNNGAIYDDPARAKFVYKIFMEEGRRASKCVQCGQCETVCPQHILIRDSLKEVALAFEEK